jgi:hypothetical protein
MASQTKASVESTGIQATTNSEEISTQCQPLTAEIGVETDIPATLEKTTQTPPEPEATPPRTTEKGTATDPINFHVQLRDLNYIVPDSLG